MLPQACHNRVRERGRPHPRDSGPQGCPSAAAELDAADPGASHHNAHSHANANLVKSLQEARTPEPEPEGLISPHAAHTAADLYADLLEALEMGCSDKASLCYAS